MDFLNQASKRVHRSSLAFEIIVLLVINIGFYFLFSSIDLFEKIYQFSRQYEVYELDEIVPLLFTISLTLIWFASRRGSETRELNRLFNELLVVDNLTGLYNREYFLNILANEIERSYRSGTGLTLIVMKVDDLVQPVEEQEDVTARQVVLELAKIAESCCRDIDMITRWGYDELLILCRDTRVEGAEVICKKVLESFRTFQFPEMGEITVRVGIASSTGVRSSTDLINRAQKNLGLMPSKNRESQI